MAIGTAKALGFDLVENFRTPYLSRSITEFWRRWHMSLSFWLRDYLYIALGGNRKGKIRTDVNLVLTMFIGGLWHGAGWNFALWGLAHGIALMVHKHWTKRVRPERLTGVPAAAYSALAWAVTLAFVMLLWVPFRAQTLTITKTYFAGLFAAQDGITWIAPHVVILIGVMAGWHALVALRARVLTIVPAERPTDWAPLLVLGGLLLAITMFAPFEASPFIYFQF